MLWRVLSRYSVKLFCLTVSVLEKFLVSENVRDRRWGGCHVFPRKMFFLSIESFRRGAILCFGKFRVSKKFMPKREYHDFL